MGDAPTPRGLGKTLGRPMGAAVEGYGPEIVRGRDRPDGANRSGQPWPDKPVGAPDEVVVVVPATTVAMGDTLRLDLPDGHLWDIKLAFSSSVVCTVVNPADFYFATVQVLAVPVEGGLFDINDVRMVAQADNGTSTNPVGTTLPYTLPGISTGSIDASFLVVVDTTFLAVDTATATIRIEARWKRALTPAEMP